MGKYESSSEQLLNTFYSGAIDTSQNYIERFHFNSGDIEDTIVSSYGQFGIVYGSTILIMLNWEVIKYKVVYFT